MVQRVDDGVAALVPLDDPGVDVGGPAHRGGVAQVLRNLRDHPGDGALAAARGGARQRRDGQADRREHRRVPGAEVLGADVQAGQVLEVAVDLRAVHQVPPAAPVVGEQLVATGRARLQRPDDPADLRVGDRLDPLEAALGQVVEDDLPVGEAHVVALQRGQPVGAVVLGVALAADPEEAEVQQPHRGGQHPLPGEPAAGQLGRDDLARVRQRRGELQHVIVLFLVALLAPARVVHVLPAPGGIEADGLDMAVRPRADPDFAPGGRDDEVLDPGQVFGRNGLIPSPQVPEPAAGAKPPDARSGDIAAPQPYRANPVGGQFYPSPAGPVSREPARDISHYPGRLAGNSLIRGRGSAGFGGCSVSRYHRPAST